MRMQLVMFSVMAALALSAAPALAASSCDPKDSQADSEREKVVVKVVVDEEMDRACDCDNRCTDAVADAECAVDGNQERLSDYLGGVTAGDYAACSCGGR